MGVTMHHENARVFMALCDAARIRVLELLRGGEKCAADLLERTGIGQSTLSHHMKILVESGIVTARKAGKWTYYSLCESGGRYAAGLLRLLTSTDETIKKRIPHLNNKNEPRRPSSMKPFTIVVDTGCDLPAAYIREHGIEVLPIPFTLNEKEYKDGYWGEISEKDFYNALRNGGVAKTSQINPNAYVEVFTEYAKQDREALFIILSGGLSACYQSALIALEDVQGTYPDCRLYPVDSIGATSINAILAMLAVRKRGEGLSAAETAAWLEERKQYIFGLFTVDDLMYLHRGGRLSTLSAIGGAILGVKPILNIGSEGKLALKDKARGRKASMELLVSQMKRSVSPDTVLDTVFINHTDCEEDARRLAEMVKAAFNVRQLNIIMISPVIGAHVGPGTLAILFEADMSRDEYEAKFYGGK